MRPIENWKFNLQIIFAIINILILACQAVIYFLSKWTDMRFPLSHYVLFHSSFLTGILLLGFQALLFRNYPLLKNLLIITILLRVFGVLFETISRIFIMHSYKNPVWIAVHSFFDLATFLIAILLFGIILTKKFNTVPLIKMFRPFAIIAIIGRTSVFIFSILVGFGSFYFIISPIRGINYLLLAIPYVFLIAYYIKLKKVYPTLTNSAPVEPDQSWPPKQD
jgi:hypothetical protein